MFNMDAQLAELDRRIQYATSPEGIAAHEVWVKAENERRRAVNLRHAAAAVGKPLAVTSDRITYHGVIQECVPHFDGRAFRVKLAVGPQKSMMTFNVKRIPR